MTLIPYYDSPDKNKRRILEWVCDKTGKCFSPSEIALSGSTPIIDSLRNSKSRLNEEKSLTEIFLNEKPYKSTKEDTEENALVGSTSKPKRINPTDRLTNRSISKLLGAV